MATQQFGVAGDLNQAGKAQGEGMAGNLDTVLARAIQASAVVVDGSLTSPRSYGVYVLPTRPGASRRYRFGNHPIRLYELQKQYGQAELLHLFLARQDAVDVAHALNRPNV